MIVLSIIIGSTTFVLAQKYHFINLNVPDGLPQSQATSLIQDNFGQLYVGTYGGLGIFDGVGFRRFDKTNGLLSNYVYQIAQDSKGQLYIAHLTGLTTIINGKTSHYNFSDDAALFKALAIDNKDRIWIVFDNNLYQFSNEQFIPFNDVIKEQRFTDDYILNINTNTDGTLLIATLNQGLLQWDGEQLHSLYKNKDSISIIQIAADNQKNEIYLVDVKSIYQLQQNEIQSIKIPSLRPEEYISKFFIDSHSNLWMATNIGGIYYNHQGENWLYFDFSKGFTSEQILNIYEDTEGSIWFASNGSGIYRFINQSLTYYDEYTTGFNPIVVSLVEDIHDQMIVAASNGLYKIDQKGKIQELLFKNQQIKSLSLVKRKDGLVYIGTMLHGLLIWDGTTLKSVLPNHPGITSSLFIHEFDLFFNFFNRIYKLSDKRAKPIKLPNSTFSTLSLDENHLLFSTLKGLFKYNIKEDTYASYKSFKNQNIVDMVPYGKYIFFGSLEDGLYVLDTLKEEPFLISTDDGLSCNSVYSLLIDSKEQLWVGTGCGLDLITIKDDEFSIKKMADYLGLGHIEANTGALYEDKNGLIWIGTNSKLFLYQPSKDLLFDQEILPPLLFESIQLYSKNISADSFKLEAIPFTDLPKEPIFRPHENHLTFNFKAVSLSQAKNIKYRYQLIGVDKDYTETKQTTVIYPNLSPGTYTFKVWASNVDGVFSTDYAIEYPFTINTPFWQTIYFWIGLLMLSIAITFGIMYYRNKWKQDRLIWAQQLREEAQAKIRQSTAEDFHDEIGNKLTRIKLLSNVAQIQASEENEKVKSTLQQIIDNVQHLFTGSKDIIWSLQPESDYLDEVLIKINQNAVDLIGDSHLNFESLDQTEIHQWKILLPMQWSRNIVMIFKEGLTNIVRHAEASKIQFNIYEDSQFIYLSLKDNGKGIAEHISYGNGLTNMKNRARRIDSELNIINLEKGTELLLKMQKSKLKERR